MTNETKYVKCPYCKTISYGVACSDILSQNNKYLCVKCKKVIATTKQEQKDIWKAKTINEK